MPPTTTSFLSNNDNESNFMLYTFILYTLNCYFKQQPFSSVFSLQSKSSKSSGSSFCSFQNSTSFCPSPLFSLTSILAFTTCCPDLRIKSTPPQRAMWIDIICVFSKKKMTNNTANTSNINRLRDVFVCGLCRLGGLCVMFSLKLEKKNEINFSFINVEKCKKIIINYVKILRQ